MDWSLYIFIAVVVFFGYRGFRNGLLKSISRILSLVAGYVAAILYSGTLSAIIESTTPLEGILAFIAASLMLFIGAGIVVNILFWLLAMLLPETGEKSLASSLGGATLGAAFGFIAAIAIVWSYAFVRDMHSGDAVVNTEPSKIEKLASRAASQTLNSAMSIGSANPELTSLSTAMIEAPAAMAKRVQRLSSSNDLTDLLNNPRNQAILNNADAESLRMLPAFQKLAHNPDMLALAKSAGMLDKFSGDTQAMEIALADQMVTIWGQAQRVKNNARVQEILSDPDFQQKIQSGNPLDLLTNAQLLELADIIFEKDVTSQSPGSANTVQSGGSQKAPAREKSVYSWTDKNGRVHYSDIEPKP
ncbi:MAG: DUF4124 domain-containing protein [Gammaproteobacteria bacterium]|nr:DUF4124 domain-containing protein [Gammaproteobacteria bacterium]